MGARILHVWNTAGVGSVIAKFCDRDFGTASRVMTRRAADRVGLTTYGKAYDDGPAVFFARALLAARGADVIHVHSLDRVVPWVKQLYPSKPVVIHYHGTDIQNRWDEKRTRWERADVVAFSTPNLSDGAPTSAVYVPNPVDTDLFRPTGGTRIPNSAVSFRYGMDEEAAKMAKSLSLDLTLLERWSVPHQEMPGTLSKYSHYIDLRKPPGKVLAESVGKAALEALACGCKVVDWEGKVIESFPPEHEPGRVAARWNAEYERLMSSRERSI